MNVDELKQEFAALFPTEIDGNKRPAEPIPSNDDWYLDAPQLIAKDPVYYAKMNMYLRVLLSNERLLKQWVNALEDAMSAQDFKIVTETVKGLMSPEMLKKLNGIQANANNYVHPNSHPATMITPDATHRFVTDTEKNTWNAKASTALVSTAANGLAPKRNGNSNNFLAGDGTWRVVERANNASNAAAVAWSGVSGKPATFPGDWNNLANKPGDVATQSWVNTLINILKNNGTLGGITGGNLAQNGWVKFSNGLILQWRITTSRNGNEFIATFPIAFNTVYAGICVGNRGGYAGVQD